MTDYRLYFLDDKGHIRDVVELECPDDDQAISDAQHHVDGMDLELWQRARMVTKLPARPPA